MSEVRGPLTPQGMAAAHSSEDHLYWRAEILQALYWMRGEGIASAATAADLAAFLAADPATVAHHLDLLRTDGFLEPADAADTRALRLTALGAAEGARSFRDEFADFTRPAHGECGPGCWCRDPKHAGEPCPNQTEHPPEETPAHGH